MGQQKATRMPICYNNKKHLAQRDGPGLSPEPAGFAGAPPETSGASLSPADDTSITKVTASERDNYLARELFLNELMTCLHLL